MKIGRFFNKKSNKGFILIYVIIMGSIMSLITANILEGLERKNMYLNYNLNAIMSEDLKQKKKEYLMTEFNGYMEEHLDEIKDKGVDKYFKENDISKYLSGIERDGLKFKEGCNIKYNFSTRLFEMNVGSFIYRFYPIINEEDINYKFVVITNEEGI